MDNVIVQAIKCLIGTNCLVHTPDHFYVGSGGIGSKDSGTDTDADFKDTLDTINTSINLLNTQLKELGSDLDSKLEKSDLKTLNYSSLVGKDDISVITPANIGNYLKLGIANDFSELTDRYHVSKINYLKTATPISFRFEGSDGSIVYVKYIDLQSISFEGDSHSIVTRFYSDKYCGYGKGTADLTLLKDEGVVSIDSLIPFSGNVTYTHEGVIEYAYPGLYYVTSLGRVTLADMEEFSTFYKRNEIDKMIMPIYSKLSNLESTKSQYTVAESFDQIESEKVGNMIELNSPLEVRRPFHIWKADDGEILYTADFDFETSTGMTIKVYRDRLLENEVSPALSIFDFIKEGGTYMINAVDWSKYYKLFMSFTSTLEPAVYIRTTKGFSKLATL